MAIIFSFWSCQHTHTDEQPSLKSWILIHQNRLRGWDWEISAITGWPSLPSQEFWGCSNKLIGWHEGDVMGGYKCALMLRLITGSHRVAEDLPGLPKVPALVPNWRGASGRLHHLRQHHHRHQPLCLNSRWLCLRLRPCGNRLIAVQAYEQSCFKTSQLNWWLNTNYFSSTASRHWMETTEDSYWRLLHRPLHVFNIEKMFNSA